VHPPQHGPAGITGGKASDHTDVSQQNYKWPDHSFGPCSRSRDHSSLPKSSAPGAVSGARLNSCRARGDRGGFLGGLNAHTEAVIEQRPRSRARFSWHMCDLNVRCLHISSPAWLEGHAKAWRLVGAFFPHLRNAWANLLGGRNAHDAPSTSPLHASWNARPPQPSPARTFRRRILGEEREPRSDTYVQR